MATKKKKSSSKKTTVYRRVTNSAKGVVSVPLMVGAIAAPGAGMAASSVLPVPPKYATVAGALLLFLGNRFAPRMISAEMVKGGVASAVGSVAVGLAGDVLGMSGPFSNNTLNARPLTREQLQQRIAAHRSGMGYQASVVRGLGYQVTATRPVPAVAPMRTGPRMAF